MRLEVARHGQVRGLVGAADLGRLEDLHVRALPGGERRLGGRALEPGVGLQLLERGQAVLANGDGLVDVCLKVHLIT